jgi:hypothetical protein
VKPLKDSNSPEQYKTIIYPDFQKRNVYRHFHARRPPSGSGARRFFFVHPAPSNAQSGLPHRRANRHDVRDGQGGHDGLQKDARFMKLKEETSMPDGMIQQDPGTGGTIFRGMLTRGRIGQR